jgi:hexaprenyl-diphosphate synthase
MAVLAGDFLLGRASVALARLRNSEVIELLATVIANLVEGEFMQLKNTARDEKNPIWTEDTITYYLQKTYLKSASLISKSCRAAALLGGSDGMTVEAAYAYGKNLGLAFQLADQPLDRARLIGELPLQGLTLPRAQQGHHDAVLVDVEPDESASLGHGPAPFFVCGSGAARP